MCKTQTSKQTNKKTRKASHPLCKQVSSHVSGTSGYSHSFALCSSPSAGGVSCPSLQQQCVLPAYLGLFPTWPNSSPFVELYHLAWDFAVVNTTVVDISASFLSLLWLYSSGSVPQHDITSESVPGSFHIVPGTHRTTGQTCSTNSK